MPGYEEYKKRKQEEAASQPSEEPVKQTSSYEEYKKRKQEAESIQSQSAPTTGPVAKDTTESDNALREAMRIGQEKASAGDVSYFEDAIKKIDRDLVWGKGDANSLKQQKAQYEEYLKEAEKVALANEWGKPKSGSDFSSYNSARGNIPSASDVFEAGKSLYSEKVGNDYFDTNGVRISSLENAMRVNEYNEMTADKLGIYRDKDSDRNKQFYDNYSIEDSYNNSYSKIISEGDKNYWSQMNDDEVQLYYYYLNKFGTGKAYEYLDYLSPILGERANEGEKKELADREETDTLDLVLKNAASVPTSVVGAVPAFVDDAIHIIQGKEVNPYNKAHEWLNYSQNVRGETSNRIVDDIENETVGNLVSNTYQAAMSGLDSIFGGTTMGSAYTISMGMGAASRRAAELTAQGVSNDKIILGSIASGAIEWLTEKYSYDKITEMIAGDEFASIWRKLGSALFGSAVEGVEEWNSDMLNLVADAIINGYSSTNEKEIRDLIAQGASDSEARKYQFKKNAIESLWSFYGGAISGAGLYAGGGLVGLGKYEYDKNQYFKAVDTKIGQNVTSNEGLSALAKLAEETAGADKLKSLSEQDTSGYSERKMERFNREVGKATRSVLTEQAEKTDRAARTEVENYIKEQFRSLGVTENLDTLASGVIHSTYENSGKLTSAESRAIAKVDTESKKVMQSLLNNKELNRRAAESYAQEASKYTFAKNLATTSKDSTEGEFKASADGKTIYTSDGKSEDVSVKSIASIADGTVLLEDGRTVKASDISYATDADALTYEVAMRYAESDEGANAIVNLLKGANVKDTQTVNNAMLAYQYGLMNERSMLSETYLDEKLKTEMFAIGRSDSAKRASAKAANAQITARIGKGKVLHFEKNVRSADKMNAQQKATVEVAKTLVKSSPLDITIFESFEENGKRYAIVEGKKIKTTANGWYAEGSNRIYIDINAGNDYSGLGLYTLSHEISHYIRNLNAAQWQTMADLVVETIDSQYDGNNLKFDDLWQNKLDKYKQFKKDKAADYVNRSDKELEDMAYEDVVCDALQSIMAEEETFVMWADKVKAKDQQLWQRIKSAIGRFLSTLRAGFSGKTAEGYAGQAIQNASKEMHDKIRELYVAAFIGANERFEIAKKGSSDNSSIVHSLRENENITARSMKYRSEHMSQSANVSDDMLNTANEMISDMVSYMKPYLDITNNNGKRYLPEEILGKTTFSNGSYGRTVENTTICFRTLAYIDFTNEIKKKIGRPLTVEESFLASQMLYDIAKEPQCLYCYVSLDRKAYDGFLIEYIKQRDAVLKKFSELKEKSKENIDTIYKEFLDGRKDTKPMKQRFNLWINSATKGEGLIRLEDLTTDEVRSEIKAKGGLLAEQMFDAERYAQSASWAKKNEQYRAYNSDILKMSETMVKNLNKHYGLRFYSFSEYTPAFIVENMQQIRDASLKGLLGLAYTKKTDFARIFAGTGMNINISVFGKMVDGKVVEDSRQGASWEEVKELRKQHKNVGAVFVATSDELTEWALAQDWIDVVIPFHIVRTGANIAEFYKWTNNTKFQADTDSSGKNKTLTPAEHHNDLATFKKLIAERGLTPRFAQFIDNPNYMKLVNETRLSDLESDKLHPTFDLEAAKKSFDAFVNDGGYYGDWYNEGIDYKAAVDTVAEDVLSGKRANEVEYGRQDINVSEEMKNRWKNREHGRLNSDRTYSYDELVSKPDMIVTHVDMTKTFSSAEAVSEARKNASAIGNVRKDGSVSVFVKDINKDVILSKPGLIHGLDRRSAQNSPIVAKAGEILSNSIKINELIPKKDEANNSYVLIGIAQDESGKFEIVESVVNSYTNVLESIDVLYSINSKEKGAAVLNAPSAFDPNYRSTISIAELLDFVNTIFSDILPESVLRHYGYGERPSGILGENALYSERKVDYGYHAGDLGKSTGDDYANQGYWRDSGHFGFGTYFVGDETKININGYGERPHEKVDFSKYNLFKPKTEERASKLHDALQVVDGFIKQYNEKIDFDSSFERSYSWEKRKKAFDDVYIDYEYDGTGKEKLVSTIESLPERYRNRIEQEADEQYQKAQERKYDEESVRKELERHYDFYGSYLYNTKEEYVKENLQETIESIKDNKKISKEEWMIRESKEIVDEYYDEERKITDKLNDLASDIQRAMGYSVSEEAVNEALAKTRDTVLQYKKGKRGLDSAATVFMKALGYEGVDVRHLKGLDNTGYGSVIYDLKGEDLERKREIGTARYSDRDSEYLELAKNPNKNEARLREMIEEESRNNGYSLGYAYHGTGNSFSSFDTSKLGEKTGHYTSKLGIFLSSNEKVAKNFAKGENPRVIKSFLSIKNPKVFELTDSYKLGGGDSFNKLVYEIASYAISNSKKYGLNDIYVDWIKESAHEGLKAIGKKADKIASDYRDSLIEQGYDGIILRGTMVDAWNTDIKMWNAPKMYIVFDSNQIKSADPVTYDDAGNVIPLSERFNEKNDDIRYSFRGESTASQEDKRNLDIAKRMDKQKVPMETIRIATGWYKQSDKKWRNEFSDADARVSDDVTKMLLSEDLYRQKDELYSKAEELNSKVNSLALEGKFDEAKAIAPKRKAAIADYEKIKAKVMREAKNIPDATYRLGDILDFPKLYRNYPSLADTVVRFSGTSTTNTGLFDLDSKEITISKAVSSDAVLTTLLHEVQHAIQDIEGFPMDSSRSYDSRRSEIEAFDVESRHTMTDEERLNNAPRRFSDRDSEYLELAKNPNKNEAKLRELVDQAAVEAGAIAEDESPITLYHGTDANFTVFDKNKRGERSEFGDDVFYGVSKLGFFATPEREYARIYQYDERREPMQLYGFARDMYWMSYNDFYRMYNGELGYGEFEGESGLIKFKDSLIEEGHDGIVAVTEEGWEEYIFFESSQLKSADLVTYDDNGNVIPLSERFNEKNDDIRYSERMQINDIPSEKYDEMKKHFGTTNNIRVAGYLLKDGTMLDFSGKHWGDPSSTTRQVDHRDISEVLPDGDRDYGAMVQMIGNGNIRLMPETGGINLSQPPTEKQREYLRYYIRMFSQYYKDSDGVVVDFDEPGGDTVYSKTYRKGTDTRTILRDIDNYFKYGKPSDLMQFHTDYSDESRRFSDRILFGSVFSGAGTVEQGLVYQMVDKEFAVEWKPEIASVYMDNNGKDHMWVGDIRKFDSSKKNHVFYLHASPVCTRYSMANHKRGAIELDMMTAKATARILEEQMPEVFTVENVKQYKGSPELQVILDKLHDLGYKYDVGVYSASDYGNPTKRERLIVRAVKNGELPALPVPVSTKTSWGEATKDLWNKKGLEPWHLSPQVMDAIKNTPALKGVDLKHLDQPLMIYGTNKSHQVDFAWADGLAPTLTTKCGDARIIMTDGKVYKPTPAFMGRLQGLPDNFKYPEQKTLAFRVIGNGVPTQLTSAVMGGLLESAYETEYGSKLYSERENTPSNRELLANAMTPLASNQAEANKLTEYTENIVSLNEQEDRLKALKAELKELSFSKGKRDTKRISELKDEITKTENRINIYDKRLLNLEAAKPLKDVLEREKLKAKNAEDSKRITNLRELYRQTLQREREQYMERQKQRIADLRKMYQESHAKSIQDMRDRYAASRARAVERRNTTEMRNKVIGIVKTLNEYLLTNSDKKHVPLGLQGVVAEALDVFNFDTVSAEKKFNGYTDENGVFHKGLNQLIVEAKDEETRESLKERAARIQTREYRVAEKLGRLKAEYDKIQKDPDTANLYYEEISERIGDLAEWIGDTSIADMSYAQLEELYDTYKMLLHTIREENKAFKEGVKQSIAELSDSVISEVRTVGGTKEKTASALKGIKEFAWNDLKPIYAFRAIGSDTLTGLFKNILKGQDGWYLDMAEAKAFRDGNVKKYGFSKWDFDTQYEFESRSGKKFKMSLGQMLSIYAYSKRDQARDHLNKGGIVFDSAIEVVEKNKWGVPIKYNLNTKESFGLTDETISEIASKLTAEQKSFVDEMQKYLSDVMGKKGNDVSLKLFGVKLFKEENYFPIVSSDMFLTQKNEPNGMRAIRSPGFSKALVRKANNPMVISDFMTVWAKHVNDMSMYHSFVLPIEDLNRVYNYRTAITDEAEPTSVKQTISNAYGDEPLKYIKTLITDLNGGARFAPGAGVINAAVGAFKKASTMASLSVVIQQPASIARAMAYIPPKYFSGAFVLNKDEHNSEWEELKKYAPVAGIKEMGYFDTDMGRASDEWLNSDEVEGGFREKVAEFFKKDSKNRDEILSKAPALADEFAWVAMWKATKNYIAATTSLEPGTEEYLKACGEKFEEVIELTQVYDSILTRSGMMRSKDVGMRMVTSFMAEPTVSANMAIDAVIEAKRTGNKRLYAERFGAIAGSAVLTALLRSIIMAWRDSDKKKYGEAYAERFLSDLLDNLNPLNLIPIGRDIVSICQGWNVDRSDMTIFTDLATAIKALDSSKKSLYEKMTGLIGAIGNMVGVPIRNIERDLRPLIAKIIKLLKGEE